MEEVSKSWLSRPVDCCLDELRSRRTKRSPLTDFENVIAVPARRDHLILRLECLSEVLPTCIEGSVF